METEITLGAVVMNMGQLHYMSTGVTYNQHWDRADVVHGLIAITGTSGRYINPFGLNGAVDGIEVLYPPMIETILEGLRPQGYLFNGGSYPVAHLREVYAREYGQARSDDSQFVRSVARAPFLDRTKLELVATLDRQPAQLVRQALDGLGLGDSREYLTYDGLLAVNFQLI